MDEARVASGLAGGRRGRGARGMLRVLAKLGTHEPSGRSDECAIPMRMCLASSMGERVMVRWGRATTARQWRLPHAAETQALARLATVSIA